MMKMASLLLKPITNFFLSYPESLLAIVCFFFIRSSNSIGGASRVNWPLIGALPTLLLHMHHVFDWGTQLLKEHGGTVIIRGPWFTRQEILLTCDPVNVNHILCTNVSNFPKGPDFRDIFDIFGDSIFSSDDEQWKIHRKMAITRVNQKRFRQFVAKKSLEKVEKGLIPILQERAQNDKAIDLQDLMLRFTFDSTCILVFGADTACLTPKLPDVPFANAIDRAEEALFYRYVWPASWWKFQRWLNIGRERKYTEARAIIDDFVAKCIEKRREELSDQVKIKNAKDEEEEEEAVDLLTSYMDDKVQDDMSIPMSDKFLRDTTLAYLFAGRDTTSAALTWFFWIVSVNPHVETKILEELDTIAPKKEGLSNKPILFDTGDLSKLVYLHAALCEALRLFPPATLEAKGVAKREILPSGHEVRPWTRIIYTAYAMARMESVWGKNCSEFKPERWLLDGGRMKREPAYKFLAFHAGSRSCVGKDMAFTQMRAVAAAVLYSFHFEVVEGHKVDPKISFLLYMQHGLMVKVRQRCGRR